MLLHLALLSATTAPPRSVIRVQNWLSNNPDASMLPAAACSPTIRYSNNDLPGYTLEGADAYSAASRAWHNDCCELLGPSYTTTVQRVAQLSSPDEVAVRWRAEWSPDSTRWLEALADAIGWEIERFDLDASTVSTFSWRAIFDLFASASTTRRLALPTASVEGRAVLRIDEASGLVTSHSESVDVIGLAAASRLRNRKVAQNTAEFLDIRRPPQCDSDEWAVEVAAAVLVGVPGAGTLEVEPLEDEREGTVAIVAFGLIAIAALSFSVRLLGDESGTGQWGASLCDELDSMSGVTLSAYAYAQCVSDMFGG